MAAIDTKWQRLPNWRRAAVYRSIGRVGREAREVGDVALTADVRLVISLLRAHAHVSAKKSAPKKHAASKKR